METNNQNQQNNPNLPEIKSITTETDYKIKCIELILKRAEELNFNNIDKKVQIVDSNMKTRENIDNKEEPDIDVTFIIPYKEYEQVEKQLKMSYKN